ncbi:hypothetical protein J1N35_037814 [Gossypium stocksii]|uniref:Uncharacterized protein n=1 Tax=Gossypium stocksii TaxID=47602 RepID=A0A9D3ZM98_9ROSI|nr:hypothetical protein J1N35_037814 [Gossypium stocksii]
MLVKQWKGQATIVSRKKAINVVTSIVKGLIYDNFNESEKEMSDFDVFSSDVFVTDVPNRIRGNLDGLNMDDIEVGELFDSDDSRRLNSVHESDSDGQN